jgi:hypothetical protein
MGGSWCSCRYSLGDEVRRSRARRGSPILGQLDLGNAMTAPGIASESIPPE